jgi:cytochrome c556
VEQHEAAMKGIAQSNGALQKNLKGNMLMDAAKDAQQLATLFGEVERFWTQNNKPDAVKLAQTARTGATEVAGAAAAGDQAKALAAAGNLGGTCKQCHGVYREGDPQAGFRIKAGTITP